jgi:predicted dinucleotide-binding enzyme
MKTGIVGAGNIGSTLARDLVSLGHLVLIANSCDGKQRTGLPQGHV